MADARQVARWIVDDIVGYIRDCPDVNFSELFDQQSTLKYAIINRWLSSVEEYVKKYPGSVAESEGKIVHHVDGDVGNNALGNLRVIDMPDNRKGNTTRRLGHQRRKKPNFPNSRIHRE